MTKSRFSFRPVNIYTYIYLYIYSRNRFSKCEMVIYLFLPIIILIQSNRNSRKLQNGQTMSHHLNFDLVAIRFQSISPPKPIHLIKCLMTMYWFTFLFSNKICSGPIPLNWWNFARQKRHKQNENMRLIEFQWAKRLIKIFW